MTDIEFKTLKTQIDQTRAKLTVGDENTSFQKVNEINDEMPIAHRVDKHINEGGRGAYRGQS